MNTYRLEIRSRFLTIKETRSGVAFNLKSGVYKKDPHYFYMVSYVYERDYKMCCCDGEGLNSGSPTFLPKRDLDLPLSSLGAKSIFKMELEAREERNDVQKE